MDPVTASSINGGNFNRYWYANNNPYKFTDPDGRLACTGSVQKSDCIRPAAFPSNWRSRGRPDVNLSAKSGGQAESSSKGNGTIEEQVDEAASGLKGIVQGGGSYFKGVLWDLPKHGLSTYGLLGDDAEFQSSVAERNVSDTIAFIATDPGRAWRVAHAGWDGLSRNQKANLEGRLLGRFAVGYVITALTGVGVVTAPAAAAGNALSAGADLNDEAEVFRVMIYGVPGQ